MNTYIEITKSEHNHGGLGWEFGTCLWSPSRNKGGADSYSLMRKVNIGDQIIHFYNHKWPDGKTENRIAGISFVKNKYMEVSVEPPSAGDWADMSPYYKIELNNFKTLENTTSLKA